MKHRSARTGAIALAAPLAAAVACLQPGIDPVFLAYLSHANAVPLSAHGLVVGMTQGGAALGALAVWHRGESLGRRVIQAMAAAAVLLSAITPWLEGTPATLAVRAGYGIAMGMVYARTMAGYAARAPGRAYALVYLLQLLLATLVSALLPEAAALVGVERALALLALAPALALAALLLDPAPAAPAALHPAVPAVPVASAPTDAPVPRTGWALAAATFWFICTTMLVWSSTAALATSAGISDRTIGRAVAIGSVVGAATALALLREGRVMPLPLTALLCGLSLAAPLVLTAWGDLAFVAAVIALNIGSTAIIVRCSGLASAASPNPRFRTFVACTHALGTIAGPLIAAAITQAGGLAWLPAGVAATLLAALAAVALAGFRRPATRARHPFKPQTGQGPSQVRMALD